MHLSEVIQRDLKLAQECGSNMVMFVKEINTDGCSAISRDDSLMLLSSSCGLLLGTSFLLASRLKRMSRWSNIKMIDKDKGSPIMYRNELICTGGCQGGRDLPQIRDYLKSLLFRFLFGNTLWPFFIKMTRVIWSIIRGWYMISCFWMSMRLADRMT
jgi:hypothetical protein